MSGTAGESIHDTILKVMADVGAIGKDQTNQHQHYNFRGIDQVMNGFHAPMVKHGLFVAPRVVAAERREVQGRNAVQTEAVLLVKFSFWNRDGDSLTVTVQGEGRDTSDKASNKAMAAALKYAMLFTFMVPVDAQDDADNVTLEPAVDVDSEAAFEATSKREVVSLVDGDVDAAKALYARVLEQMGLERVVDRESADAVVAMAKSLLLEAPFEKPVSEDEGGDDE